MTIEITYEQAKSLLEEVVAERGEDFVYEPPPKINRDGSLAGDVTSCVYFDPRTSEPSCGVGVVLAKLGLTRDDLKGTVSWGCYDYNGGAGPHTLSRYAGIISGPPRAINLLSQFQEEQDTGKPYGVALERALERTAS